MRVLLAPMEVCLILWCVKLLTEVNDYDLCITEFVRVVDQLLPAKVFYRLCPELHHDSRTPSGTRVRVQLLGPISASGWPKTPPVPSNWVLWR
jgi:tRNA-dihydrouridine synthase C